MQALSRLNRQPAFRYSPVGRCIYCSRSENPLSDEHPIPFALGGNLILPQSSCADCANKTHRYEGVTMRSTLGTLRMRFNFPTRRKRERPASVEIGTIDAKGRTGRAKVPIDEYPVGVALPHFGRAGLFLGSIPELDTLQHVARSFYLNGDMDGFREKYHWDGVLQFRWMPVELLVVANCSVFPGSGTPIYEVVLGYVDDPDHFSDFYDRLKGGRLEIGTTGLL